MALRRDIRVLVADDMSVSRQVLLQMLEHIGIDKARAAQSGQDALNMLDQDHYDVLIADLNMPAIGGLELLRRVRDHRNHHRIGFVMTSGDVDSDKVADAWSLGMHRFLPKPFDLHRLITCLEGLTGRL